jgi:hypothetical protein
MGGLTLALEVGVMLDKEEGRQNTAQHTTDLATQTQLKNCV